MVTQKNVFLAHPIVSTVHRIVNVIGAQITSIWSMGIVPWIVLLGSIKMLLGDVLVVRVYVRLVVAWSNVLLVLLDCIFLIVLP